MEQEPVSVIRECSRNLVKLHRRFHRDEETDVRRSVETLRITQETVSEIANRLKTKSFISAEELQTLKNGLMEDPKYIELVLNTHGALRGLVRELTGAEVRKQTLAAGCCCNLALGDSRACVTVAKAAGPYLVAALDSLSTELAVTSAWALGNLAGSGPRTSALLTAQGALTKVGAVAALHTPQGGEMFNAAVYATTHFAWQMKDELGTDCLNKILQSLNKAPLTTESSQLLFILSCHRDFQISEEFLLKILNELPVCLNNDNLDKCKKNLYLIRTLANISVNETVYVLYVNYFMQFVGSIKIMLQRNDEISESLFWLLGNLLNFCSDSVLFEELLK